MVIGLHTVFGKKIFRMLTGFTVAMLLAFAVVLRFTVFRDLQQNARLNIGQIAERTADELESLLDDMDKISLYISTSPMVMRAFNGAASGAVSSQALSLQLVSMITSITIPNNASRYRVSLYNHHGNFMTTGIPVTQSRVNSVLQANGYMKWYESLPVVHNRGNITALKNDSWSDSETRFVSLYREIFDPILLSKSNGVIEVQCPQGLIADILSFTGGDYQCALFDSDGAMFFQTDGEWEADAAGLFGAYGRNAAMDTAGEHGEYLYAGVPVGDSWTLILAQAKDHAYGVMRPITLLVAAILTGSALAVLIAAYLITRRMTEPLQVLTESIRKVSPEQTALNEDVSRYSDEFANLNSAFNEMLRRLNVSMEENVRRQAMEMRANMIALQNQMDPHFLYNMLAVIRATSSEGNNLQIALTCDYLSSMLRYISVPYDEPVSIGQEIAHGENYLKLMKMRFENQLDYEVNIGGEVDIEKPIIPRLSVQPLIENCFQHAFKNALPPWRIIVSVWNEQEWWHINITDNGQSITSEDILRLEGKLEQFLRDPSDTVFSLRLGGMGLINTIARLKLRYGENAKHEIKPAPQGGTSITLGGKLND